MTAERMRHDVTGAKRGDRVKIRQARGEGIRPQVDHDRQVARDGLGGLQERRDLLVLDRGRPHLEAHDHVGVARDHRQRGVQIEVLKIVRQVQAVREEVLGRQVQQAGIQQREHLGTHVRGLGPGPRHPEGRDSAGTAVDHDRNALLDSGAIGMDAEVTQPRIDVDVKVDQAGSDQEPAAIDHLGARIPAREPGADRFDRPIDHDDVADLVASARRVDHAAARHHPRGHRGHGRCHASTPVSNSMRSPSPDPANAAANSRGVSHATNSRSQRRY